MVKRNKYLDEVNYFNELKRYRRGGLIRMTTDPLLKTEEALSPLVGDKPAYALFNEKVYYIEGNKVKDTFTYEGEDRETYLAQLKNIFTGEDNKLKDVSKEDLNSIANLTSFKNKDFLAELRRPIDYKANLRAAKAAEKQAYYAEQNALSKNLWKVVREKAKKILNSEQMGYDNPIAILMNIIHTSVDRNMAIWSHNSLAHFFYRTVPEWIGTNLLLGQDRLPGLKYFVELNDDNELNIKHLIRDNHDSNPRAAIRNMVRGNMEDEFTREQVLAFQAIVVAWLEECHGWEADEDHPGKFTKNGFELTKKQFSEYLDYKITDPNNMTLDSYLKEKLQNVEVQDLRPKP